MATIQSVVDSARVVLQDADKVRYTDAQLLEYANDGISVGFKYRPDFRLGNYTVALGTYALTDQVPFPANYQHLLKHYIVARAEIRDDEYSQDGRAAALLGIFEKEIKA